MPEKKIQQIFFRKEKISHGRVVHLKSFQQWKYIWNRKAVLNEVKTSVRPPTAVRQCPSPSDSPPTDGPTSYKKLLLTLPLSEVPRPTWGQYHIGLTPLYWPQVERRTGAMSREVFYGRTDRRTADKKRRKNFILGSPKIKLSLSRKIKAAAINKW